MKKILLFSLLGFLCVFASRGQNIIKYRPLDNAVVHGPSVDFSWKRRPDVTTYTLEVSTDALFTAPQQFTTAAAGYQIPSLPTGAYWWRVKGDNGPWTQGQFRVLQIGVDVVPQMWLRAETGTTVASGLVSAWQNAMGGSLAQTDALRQPGYETGSLGGYPSVRFGKQGAAGDHTFLNITPNVTLTNGENTLLEVLKLNYNPTFAQYFLSGNGPGFYPGGPGLGPGVYDGNNFRYATAGPLVDWQLISYRKNEIRRNGSAPMAGTGPGIGQTFSLTQLGKRGDLNTLFFTGNLSELILFDYQVNDSILTMLSQYLMGKYTRPVRLPYDTLVCAESLPLSLPGGAAEYGSILWSTGANTANVSITANGVYWARATSKFGITTVDTIRVKGIFPKPQITPATQQYFCFGRDTVTFNKVGGVPGIIYTWYTGSLADSVRVGSGNKVYLTAFDPLSGCAVTSDTTLVTHKTRADFAAPPACPGDSAFFTNLSADLTGDTITSWLWNFGDPGTTADVSTDTNGVWPYAQSGTYSVKLRVTASDGCADSTTKTVTVKPSATPGFNWQGLCFGKPTQFFDQSMPQNGTQVTGYQWNFGPGVTSTFVNPAVTFATGGTYPVTLKIFTASGCSRTLTQQVPVNRGVDAAFAVADSLCARHDINILEQSQGINDNITGWVWRFGSAAPVTGQAPVFAFQGTGNRVVRLTTTTASGCVDSVQKTVYVRPAPTADFSFVVNGGVPPFVPVVQNLSTGATHVAWNFGNGAGFANTDYTPVLPAFADTGIYTVTLAAGNTEGCTDTVSKNFVVFTGDRTLQLTAATCTTEGGFVKYTARVLNKGALTVDDITFGANLDYNSVIREKWTGSLNPGQVLEYTFNASAQYFTSADFCCVRIERFNDTLRVQPPDDKICLPLGEGVWFSTAYPTPTDGSITIDRSLPFADKLGAELCSVDGKVIRTFFANQSVNAGYGTYTADISDLRAGMYVVRFYYREKYYSVKVVKR